LTILKRKSDFDRVFRQGRRHRGRTVALVCLHRSEGTLRAAFVAGRAVGGAVRRNRQRRRLREACRQVWPQIADRAADVVFVAQPAAEASDFSAVCREMEALLRRAGLLPPSDQGAGEASR
jgi:ribonuclease P protein component